MDNLNPVFATSPLDGVSQVGNSESVQLYALPSCAKINMRGNGSDPDMLAAVKEITGLSLPLEPNTMVTDDTTSLLWLGPDEWQWRHTGQPQLELDVNFEISLVSKIEQNLAGIHSSVVDTSDYYVLIGLQGPETFAVLEKGTPLNLRQALSDTTQCAQTRFGNAAVLLNLHDSNDLTVHIQVRWSYAEYLWLYLSEAMQEFEQVSV